MFIWCWNYLGGFNFKKGNEFPWHPFLMYFGFMFCFGHSALAFKTFPFSHKTNKIIHFFFQTIGMVSITIGLIAVLLFHNNNKYPHFYSLHSWLGIGVYGIFVIQYIAGIYLFLFPKVNYEKKNKLLPFHMMFGSWMFIAVGVVCLIGMQEKLAFIKNTKGTCVQRLSVCTLGNSIGVVIFVSMFFIYVSLYNFSRPLEYVTESELYDTIDSK